MYWQSAKSSTSSHVSSRTATKTSSVSSASESSSAKSGVTARTLPHRASTGRYAVSFSVEAGSRSANFGAGATGSAFRSALLSAAMCSAVVPQQPPKMATPALRNSGTSSTNCSGGQLYTVLPSTISGMPALGLTISGTRENSRRRFICGSISAGPAEQFRPNASMPMPCKTVRAAVISVPERLRPFSSQVKVTKMGLSLTLRTARTAALASESVIIVSMTKRSTPACSRPAACSV